MSLPKSRKTYTDNTIRIGVSACLLGQEVRYDGGHSYEPYVAETLAGPCELISVCPEAELGMGTPRETVDLVGLVDEPHMVATHTRKDWTGPMNRWSAKRARELAAADLCGYVFKRNSPSCGVFRVKVHQEQGPVKRKGRGLFAAEFSQRFPLVPIEEEVRLRDPQLRENFIVRVFALQRLRQIFAGRWQRNALVLFHARETELLQTHDPRAVQQLDQMVALMPHTKPAVFRDQYQAAFMAILAKSATPARHARVLNQLTKILVPHISRQEQRVLRDRITDFRQGHLPLLVPQTLLRHYAELHGVEELDFPSYLNPDPRERLLCNHA